MSSRLVLAGSSLSVEFDLWEGGSVCEGKLSASLPSDSLPHPRPPAFTSVLFFCDVQLAAS